MKLRNDNRILAAFTACVGLCLPACERVLDVVDQLEPPGSNPSGGGASPTGPACSCASSASLLPLSCGLSPVPLLDNDVVQLTADGGVVAFNVCNEAWFDCDVARWDGSTSVISRGLMLGSSASGERVLSTGDGSSMRVFDVNGAGVILPLNMLVGRGSLSAAGDVVVGTQWLDEVGYLSRADVASGEIEHLGVIGGLVARTFVTPDASQIVGWISDDLDPSQSHVFRWNEQDGFVVGQLPGVAAATRVWPEAISADGKVIAGRVFPSAAYFRYTEADGLVEIASTSGRSETVISTDGSVVVGSLDPDGNGGSATFRWTEETGAVNVTPGVTSLAIDASDDGGVVVASSWDDAQLDGADPLDTFVWDAENGTRSLDEVLQDRGVDVTGWQFGHARAISGDGKVLVGRAHCGDAPTLYRIVLAD